MENVSKVGDSMASRFKRAVAMLAIAVIAVLLPAVTTARAATDDSEPSLSVDDPTAVVTPGSDQDVTFTISLAGSADPPARLPETGSSTMPIVAVAAVLAVVGAAVIASSRRGSRALPIIVVGAAASSVFAAAPHTSADAAPAGGVTVSFHTEDGTATAPGDYTAASGSLTFVAGQTAATVAITLDPHTDGGTFALVLTDPDGATLADPRGTATIVIDTPVTTETPTTAADTTTVTETTAPAATTSTTIAATTVPPTSTSTSTSTTTTSTTSTTTTSTTTTSTTVAPVEGCVAFHELSYRVPNGATVQTVTAANSGGEMVDVGYVVLEGWYSSTCTGFQPRSTVFYLTGDQQLRSAARDVLHPDNCDCGYFSYMTVEPFGDGTVNWLTG